MGLSLNRTSVSEIFYCHGIIYDLHERCYTLFFFFSYPKISKSIQLYFLITDQLIHTSTNPTGS